MWKILLAFLLWLTEITISTSEPVDINMMKDKFNFDKRVLADDSQNVARPNSSSGHFSRTSPAPPQLSSPSNSRPDPRPGSHPHRSSFYTPSLPRNHISNIFADQPTLRGSHAAANPAHVRRPQVPPLPSPAQNENHYPAEVPISSEDTPKKVAGGAINTLSVEKLPEKLNYSDSNNSSSVASTTYSASARFLNNTLDVVGAAAPNMSQSNILRILHNSNSNKDSFFVVSNSRPLFENELNSPRFLEPSLPLPSPPPKLSLLPIPITVYGQEEPNDPGPLLNLSSITNDLVDIADHDTESEERPLESVTSKADQSTDAGLKFIPELSKMNLQTELKGESRTRMILGSAWDIHVYFISIPFALLVGCSAFSLARISYRTWLFPYGYFASTHAIIMVIGCVRCFYLLYDPYNLRRSLAPSLNRLMYDIVFPLLICVFSLCFLFLMKAVPLKMHFYCIFKRGVFLGVVLLYLALSLGIDLVADSSNVYLSTLVLVSQCMFVIMCFSLGVTYILFYKYVTTAYLHQPSPVQMYTSTCADFLKPCVANAVRLMLAVSLLGLLMAVVQVIGIFYVADPLSPVPHHPWLWWASQLSVRVIEVSICFLVLWAAVLTSEEDTDKEQTYSAGPRYQWPVPAGNNTNYPASVTITYADSSDLYPVPTTGTTGKFHRSCTLQPPTKEVYEDVFQYYDTNSHSVTHIPAHLMSASADSPMLRRNLLGIDGMKLMPPKLVSSSADYVQSPASMLVDDRGVIRFRSITDDEQISPVESERIRTLRNRQCCSS